MIISSKYISASMSPSFEMLFFWCPLNSFFPGIPWCHTRSNAALILTSFHLWISALWSVMTLNEPRREWRCRCKKTFIPHDKHIFWKNLQENLKNLTELNAHWSFILLKHKDNGRCLNTVQWLYLHNLLHHSGCSQVTLYNYLQYTVQYRSASQLTGHLFILKYIWKAWKLLSTKSQTL